MRIRDVRRGYVRSAGRVRRRPDRAGVEPAPGIGASADRVEISDLGLEVQRARLLALQAPDIRIELVEKILLEIQEGRYRVSGRDVLPKMLREHWMEHRSPGSGPPPEDLGWA